MYITLNNFSPVIISCLVYMLYDDKLYMLKSINKVSVLFCSILGVIILLCNNPVTTLIRAPDKRGY